MLLKACADALADAVSGVRADRLGALCALHRTLADRLSPGDSTAMELGRLCHAAMDAQKTGTKIADPEKFKEMASSFGVPHWDIKLDPGRKRYESNKAIGNVYDYADKLLREKPNWFSCEEYPPDPDIQAFFDDVPSDERESLKKMLEIMEGSLEAENRRVAELYASEKKGSSVTETENKTLRKATAALFREYRRTFNAQVPRHKRLPAAAVFYLICYNRTAKCNYGRTVNAWVNAFAWNVVGDLLLAIKSLERTTPENHTRAVHFVPW
eukprot:TRINITY_DN2032_c0_g1_i30.p2 TRINITY_DN2032_c0_g1~~TRINITY_DN2032_c0_g1_i30.p2  ORF type:complete len:269 (-),score=76.98 TRINITY_DN2032_c0_g1_i30:93-899(-)